MKLSKIVYAAGIAAMAALLGTGCAAKLAIKTMEPGPVNLGAAKHLAILDTEGRRSAREQLIGEIISQARTAGYYTVEDRSEEGVKVNIAGRTVTLEGGEKGIEPGQMGVRFDVIEWDADKDTEERSTRDSKGNTVTKQVKVLKGRALLGVTVFDPSGKALVAEKEYEGTSSLEGDVSKDQAIEAAAKDVVAKLLADITPHEVTRQVRLDEDDDALKPYIETAQAGNLAKAAEDMKGYLDKNPNSAPAAYNLAVLTDAMGNYDAAIQLYDKALQLGNKDYYSEARAECAQRKAAADALNQ